jgi:hypothetical protein
MVSVPLLLQGCANLTLYDETRAKLSADTKKAYANAKVREVIDADRQNLATLLTAELDVVRENARFQADWASLQLANDVQPMGLTVALSATQMIKGLGFDSPADLRTMGDAFVKRAILLPQIDRDRYLLSLLKYEIPNCDDKLPNAPVIPTDMAASDRQDLNRRYASYYNDCKDLLATKVDPKGKIAAAQEKWLVADKAQVAADKAYRAAQDKLRQAKKEYEDAVKEAADASKASPDLAKKIADKAEKLGKAVEDAKKLDKGLEHEPLVDSLIDLLTAAAGGDVNPSDPSLQGAVAVAKQIPSLAGDVKALETERKAPPVAGLLIALRHQTLLSELAKQRALLQAERVGIYKAAFDLYMEAAQRWQTFFDATCNYAVLAAKKPHPRDACDVSFEVKQMRSDPDKVECRYKGAKLEGCVLEEAWKERLRAKEATHVKRQLYAALAAYMQAIELQEKPKEQNFKEIDVRHRETLLAKRSAIEQWDNLVSVPLDQLEAYYMAGVKPQELADLIVKALGFTAIAIGVSK